MIVKMIKELRRKMDADNEKSEVFKKGLENIKNNQTELKNIINEKKKTKEGINSGLNEEEKWITELEDKVLEITAAEQKKRKKKKKKRHEDSLRDL